MFCYCNRSYCTEAYTFSEVAFRHPWREFYPYCYNFRDNGF